MLFRVFSRSLDREKTWYALNDRLCGKQPRKFSEGSFFQLFPDEFLRVNFADLHDENGCPVSSRVLLTCEAARRARHHARRARHARHTRHRNFLNFYIYTFVKVILGNHFLIN